MSRLAILILGIVLGAAAVFLTLPLWRDPGTLPTGRVQATSAHDAADLPTPVPQAIPPHGYPADAAPRSMSATPDAQPPITSGTLTNTTPPSVVAIESPAIDALPMPAVAEGERLLVPVQGILPKQLSDTFTQSRGEGRLHDAIDILAPRGTPVLAVADGRVAKLFTSKPGGLTLYQFDADEKLAYYYAHLDAYSPTLVEGQQLHRGDVIGYVGSTGNASPEAPHLHFAIFILGADKKWWQGKAINPYPLLGGG